MSKMALQRSLNRNKIERYLERYEIQRGLVV